MLIGSHEQDLLSYVTQASLSLIQIQFSINRKGKYESISSKMSCQRSQSFANDKVKR